MKILQSCRKIILTIFVILPISISNAAVIHVQRVVDGDTFVDSNGVKYRLLGVDTPETKDPNKPIEPFGIEAFNMTRSLIEGEDVTISRDPESDKVDKYGRQLVIVKVGEIELNTSLVLLGMARVERRFPLSKSYLSELSDTEAYAKSSRVGIWSDQPQGQNRQCASKGDFCSSINGAVLVANDGTYLGIITSRYHAESIFNEYGLYGSKYGIHSIWNDYGLYGGKYSINSPFNPYSISPPKIFINGSEVGKLSVNNYIANAIDPYSLKGACRW